MTTPKTFLALGVAAISITLAAPALADDDAANKKGSQTDVKRKPVGNGSADKGAQAADDASRGSTTGTAVGEPDPKSKIRNEDADTDLAVGTTRTTGAARPGERTDVIESRPEERRKVDNDRFTLAPMFGYGSRDLNLGVGARAGYTFRNVPVYVTVRAWT